MYHIYKTTNKLNGKYYIGVSNGNNPWYKGSGTALKTAIKKYGAANFDVEILETFESAEDMYQREAEIVNEDFVKNPLTYNCKLGGKGGRGSKRSDEHKKNISKTIVEKMKAGLLKSNGGRKRKMPYEKLIEMVQIHGIVKTAKILDEPYTNLRSRYYSAIKKLTSNK